MGTLALQRAQGLLVSSETISNQQAHVGWETAPSRFAEGTGTSAAARLPWEHAESRTPRSTGRGSLPGSPRRDSAFSQRLHQP